MTPAGTQKRRKGSAPRPRRLDDDREGLGETTLSNVVSGALHYLKPKALKREGGKLLEETVRVLKGESELTLNGDPRFKDESWKENPIYKRVGQEYMAVCRALDGLLADKSDDWRDHERARFVVDLVESGISPTNMLIGNPAAMKKAVETRGKSLLKGASNFVRDVRHNRGLPSTVDSTPFEVGKNMAATPGAVVYRNDQLELIQYKPTTKDVYEIPVLLVTPQVNKYYVMDLSPGRSLVEYLTSQGYQVFIVSWKNPGPKEYHWALDDYCEALNEAIDVVRKICRVSSINAFGICAGGITLASLLCHLTYIGKAEKINAITFAVTMLDFSYPASIGVFKIKQLLQLARWNSHRQGLLDSKDLGLAFTLMRPNDLIFNYWVNNYLMGNDAPQFDILAWNADGTNLPEALYDDFLDLFEHNILAKPGAMRVLGSPCHLKKVKKDSFVAAAIRDHLTPWHGCYQTTQLLGGRSEFVLSSSGHIAGLVNPPGNPKATYRMGPRPGQDYEQWLADSKEVRGSWWERWVMWASTRSGGKRRAKTKLGSAKYPPLGEAPGTYVHGKA